MTRRLLKMLLGIALILPWCFMLACVNLGPTGGHRAQFIVTLTSLSPSSVTAGGPPFVLTLNGTNMTAGYATLVWNGGQKISSVGAGRSSESTQATFLIDPSLIANPGSISIAVVDGINSNLLSNALTFTVSPRTTTACPLYGMYHYFVQGFDKTANRGTLPVATVGAFGVDASGNVSHFTSDGFEDAAGQCTNGATATEGTLKLPCNCGTFTATNSYTFVLQQGNGGPQRGRLAEVNDAIDGFNTLSGSGLLVQVTPDGVFTGDYAFGMVGVDRFAGNGQENQFGVVGKFTINNGNLTGTADFNDGGVLGADLAIAPSTSPPFTPDIYGVALVNVTIGAQPADLTLYMTSDTGGFVAGSVDTPVVPSSFANLVGFVSSQANPGTYSNTSLNSSVIVSTSGAPPPLCCTTSTDTTLGLASGFNSSAGTFNLLLDNVSNGVSNLNQTVTGATYSIESNGRATVSFISGGATRNYVYYLDGANDGYILGLGSSVEFGLLQPQAPGPFATSTINGTLASATFLPPTPASPNLATEIALNNGNLSANTPVGALTGTYVVASSGRGTAVVNLPVLGGTDLLFYVISPSSVVVMGSDSTTSDAITFMHF